MYDNGQYSGVSGTRYGDDSGYQGYYDSNYGVGAGYNNHNMGNLE